MLILSLIKSLRRSFLKLTTYRTLANIKFPSLRLDFNYLKDGMYLYVPIYAISNYKHYIFSPRSCSYLSNFAKFHRTDTLIQKQGTETLSTLPAYTHTVQTLRFNRGC